MADYLQVDVPVGDPFSKENGIPYYSFMPDGSFLQVNFNGHFNNFHEAEFKAGRWDHALDRSKKHAIEKAVTILPPSSRAAPLVSSTASIDIAGN